jgi:hypothetical protein
MKPMDHLPRKPLVTSRQASLEPWNDDPSLPPLLPFWQPPPSTTTKLLVTGATVGTLVDSLHNQVLLRYEVAPVQIPSLLHENAFWDASSWTVPPLLAVAYLVLGGILPRVVSKVIQSLQSTKSEMSSILSSSSSSSQSPSTTVFLRNRALWAVATTAMIVKLSDLLERHPSWGSLFQAPLDAQHLILLFGAAFLQWWWLDRTAAAFFLATLAAYGGPLAELPFCIQHVWIYLPEVAHYTPFQGDTPVATILRALLGADHSDVAISCLSAPCYFAVTMDAIALGRWFDADAPACHIKEKEEQ